MCGGGGLIMHTTRCSSRAERRRRRRLLDNDAARSTVKLSAARLQQREAACILPAVVADTVQPASARAAPLARMQAFWAQISLIDQVKRGWWWGSAALHWLVVWPGSLAVWQKSGSTRNGGIEDLGCVLGVWDATVADRRSLQSDMTQTTMICSIKESARGVVHAACPLGSGLFLCLW